LSVSGGRFENRVPRERIMPASEQSNSSLLIGVAVSALTHVGAFYALRHIEVGVGGSHVSTASFAPLAPVAARNQPPLPQNPADPPPPPDPAEQPPPRDLDREIRFGDDRSTIESMTWLGTDEPTTPSGKRGELDQAALTPEPGEEGTPGSPFVAIVPSPSPPSPGATAASQPGAPAPPTPLPSPPTSDPLPQAPDPMATTRPEKPTDPSRPTDHAAEELKKPKDAPLPVPSEKVLPKPGSEDVPGQADPLSESAGQDGKDVPQAPADQKPDQPANAERKGEKVPPSDQEGTAKNPEDAGKSPDSEAGKPGAADGKGSEEATPEQRKAPEEQPADEKPNEATPAQPTPIVPNPGAPAEQPSGPPGPKASGSPTDGQGDGGQNKLNGRVSEQESEAFTSKPIVNPMRDATVQAGKGLKIITRRAVFTNTTLVTQQPRDTLVRVRFQRDGTVKKAEFVEGGSTGNPNIDEPILNAVHRWRASGKDLERLSAKDTLSVVIRITFR
jgi:hypothetical protein